MCGRQKNVFRSKYLLAHILIFAFGIYINVSFYEKIYRYIFLLSFVRIIKLSVFVNNFANSGFIETKE